MTMVEATNCVCSGFSGTDLQDEIRHLSQSMHQEFRVKKQPCIYDPDKFQQFCISSGASTIFDNVLSSMTTSRRSTKRNEQNKKVTVNIIYTLCFALSQLNNFLQKDQSFQTGKFVLRRAKFEKLLQACGMRSYAIFQARARNCCITNFCVRHA